MRQAEEHRRELGGEGVGVRFRWVPGVFLRYQNLGEGEF